MNKIILEQTSEMCPEQYFAYKGSHRIGYLRLRWGHFTCDYLPNGNLSTNDVRLVDYRFVNDEYKGSFDNEDERKFWLDKCKEELLKYYTKNKHKL